MIKNAVSKMMWVGRATVFLIGLAVILALVFGAASMAFAGNGDPWRLGQNNVATAITVLGGAAGVDGPMVRLTNNNGGTDDTALELGVQSGEPPMKVNSSTKVANLNADQLDGKDSSNFFPAGGALPSGTTLRGNYEIDGDADEDVSTLGTHSVASNAISFGFALTATPVVHTIDVNETPPPECPGTASAPEAAPGHLCIYESFEENERDPAGNFYPNTLNTTRYGTGLYTQSQSAGRFFVSRGTWAVTAP
jgi:hypothetical protein